MKTKLIAAVAALAAVVVAVFLFLTRDRLPAAA